MVYSCLTEENNFPIPRKRKNNGSPSPFGRKWRFTSLVSSDGETKRHHSYKAYTAVKCEIIHSEDVQCSTREWPCAKYQHVIEFSFFLPGYNF